jgi:DNA-3-methyladenine glycosylase
MFEHPGRAYVYFIYGMYEMLNFVTEREGHPGAVLIRAIEPVAGVDLMRKRRKGARGDAALTNGPGRLTRALAIRMRDNRAPLQGPRIFVCDDGRKPAVVCASPRVGIREGAAKMWRFFDSESPFVSPVSQNRQARRI